MTILKVRHITHYTYHQPVGFGAHRILFRPRDSYDQRLLQSSLAVLPEPSDLHWIHDVFGNCVAVAQFRTMSTQLRFETSIVLDHTRLMPLEFRGEAGAAKWPFDYDDEILPDLAALRIRQYADDGGVTMAWARRFVDDASPRDTADILERMTHAIHADFSYRRRIDRGTQTPAETLASQSGSCRDFALLMMEAARALGFAARFVTGYIYVPMRAGAENLGGGATHAWAQVFLPGAGWVEFDPTNGIIGNRDLIRVGVARDPVQAIPLWGTHTGQASDFAGMTVQVNVTDMQDTQDTAAAP